MSDAASKLFSPITLGKRTLRNRLVFLPHATGQGFGGVPTEGHAAYFARRAEGGVGLIIQEATPVHPASLARTTHVKGYDPAVIEPAKRVSAAVHRAGAMMMVQISHRGLAALPLFSGMAVWAPSPSRSPHTGEIAHAVTLGEIKEIIAGFAQTARNFMEGGYDGVEIHATHGHLLNSFVSPKLNWRKDAYGGSVENRHRLLIEVLQALRELPLGILGIRIAQPAWNTGPEAQDAAAIIKAIEPYVDYISVTGGTQATKHFNMGDMYSQPGYMLELARQAKQATSKPVIAAGRLHDPLLAESVIESGSADLVGMARGMICDPDWASKARNGAAATIRPCIACNTCLERVDSGAPIGCIHNPRTGREDVLSKRQAALRGGKQKDVLVIGGGPAGMQAALRAAELGWWVTLVEATDTLGGQVAIAASVPGRGIMSKVTDFLQRELAAAGVHVVTRRKISPNAEGLAQHDGVIVATGAAFSPPPEDSSIAIRSWRAEDILLDPQVRRGQRILVVDDDGLPGAAGAAEVLAAQGAEVHLVLSGSELGGALPVTNRHMMMARLYALPLRWHVHSVLRGVSDDGTATLEKRGEGEIRLPGKFDAVIYGPGRTANSELIEALEAAGSVPFTTAGDCVAPRTLFSATRDGYDAADRLAALMAR
jgi:2,4-dienoyl-CoA reductase-like NADH-dependent reductase (Old Yellow Enzyme family)/thioredoxin reductase